MSSPTRNARNYLLRFAFSHYPRDGNSISTKTPSNGLELQGLGVFRAENPQNMTQYTDISLQLYYKLDRHNIIVSQSKDKKVRQIIWSHINALILITSTDDNGSLEQSALSYGFEKEVRKFHNATTFDNGRIRS